MIEQRKRNRGQGGFTLIELLVVVAILAILGGVAVFAVGNLTGGSRESACKVEYDSVKTAIAAAEATGDSNDDSADFLDQGPAGPVYWDINPGPPESLSSKAVGNMAAGETTRAACDDIEP